MQQYVTPECLVVLKRGNIARVHMPALRSIRICSKVYGLQLVSSRWPHKAQGKTFSTESNLYGNISVRLVVTLSWILMRPAGNSGH